jgi:CubicO group peptidase (beta-lactamase class C family)
MAMSHTSDLKGDQPILGPGAGFGLGFKVVTDLAASQATGSEGIYGWSGIYGTNFWIDPKEKLAAVLMVQLYPGAPIAPTFQTLTYQSLIGPPAPLPARPPASRLRPTSAAAPTKAPTSGQAATR